MSARRVRLERGGLTCGVVVDVVLNRFGTRCDNVEHIRREVDSVGDGSAYGDERRVSAAALAERIAVEKGGRSY